MATRVNDVHSGLNETVVREVIPVDSVEAIQSAIRRSKTTQTPVSIAGGRNAMGGQQYCSDAILLDTRPLNRVLSFDRERGLVEVEAGIYWPALIDWLQRAQHGEHSAWGIAQKQTGANSLSIGGALAANAHGRGLLMRPFVSDVKAVTLVDANGQVITCSRERNQELFSLVAGGYGLFGCSYSVTIRLVRQRVLRRIVAVRYIENLIDGFLEHIQDGCVYGDFQFATDECSSDFLRKGVFSCYRPIEEVEVPPAEQSALTPEQWNQLILLAHTDKSRAFEQYSRFYLSTDGQLYYSDSHQLAHYSGGYHRLIDKLTGAPNPGSEIISELYVPFGELERFMNFVREDFRANDTNLIYGTIRLIEPDEDSYLRWATNRWACVVFNICTEHSPKGIEKSIDAFRRLIDRAISCGGSYYLTYHRWATRKQVEACYPRLPDFLLLKRKYDPEERFQSDWYNHYRAMFLEDSGSRQTDRYLRDLVRTELSDRSEYRKDQC